MNYDLASFTAVIFALGTASYFFESEAVRGFGRIVLGIAGVLFGLCFIAGVTPSVWSGSIILLCGLITAGAGARKFLRRNLPQAQVSAEDKNKN